MTVTDLIFNFYMSLIASIAVPFVGWGLIWLYFLIGLHNWFINKLSRLIN